MLICFPPLQLKLLPSYTGEARFVGRSNVFYETKIMYQKKQTRLPIYRPFFGSEAKVFIQHDFQIWPQELSLQD